MQIRAIRTAKAKGYTVIASDYLPDAPGKSWADYSEMASTFDLEGNIQVARKYNVDGVFTIGTDQPVLTAAGVAEALGLPHPISTWTALRATNKRYMKEVFMSAGIPCSRSLLIQRHELSSPDLILDRLKELRFPIVIKPLDSQGQRGIYKIYHADRNILDRMGDTFRYTRSDEILAEEFFEGDELTVSAWVADSEPHILMVTDRPLIDIEPHLGTPDGHIYPSVFSESHHERITFLIRDVVQAFRITSGPLYVQMMINGGEMIIVEVACRIGGGHEEELIPLVTGIDVVDKLIDTAAGKSIQLVPQPGCPDFSMVRFVVARPGKVGQVGDLASVLAMPGVVNAGFYRPDMANVEPLIDSTRRVGYLLVKGDSRQDMLYKAAQAYRKMQIWDDHGNNLVVDTHQPDAYYKIYRKGDGS